MLHTIYFVTIHSLCQPTEFKGDRVEWVRALYGFRVKPGMTMEGAGMTMEGAE